jgi:hypothetical protein
MEIADKGRIVKNARERIMKSIRNFKNGLLIEIFTQNKEKHLTTCPLLCDNQVAGLGTMVLPFFRRRLPPLCPAARSALSSLHGSKELFFF